MQAHLHTYVVNDDVMHSGLLCMMTSCTHAYCAWWRYAVTLVSCLMTSCIHTCVRWRHANTLVWWRHAVTLVWWRHAVTHAVNALLLCRTWWRHAVTLVSCRWSHAVTHVTCLMTSCSHSCSHAVSDDVMLLPLCRVWWRHSCRHAVTLAVIPPLWRSTSNKSFSVSPRRDELFNRMLGFFVINPGKQESSTELAIKSLFPGVFRANNRRHLKLLSAHIN